MSLGHARGWPPLSATPGFVAKSRWDLGKSVVWAAPGGGRSIIGRQNCFGQAGAWRSRGPHAACADYLRYRGFSITAYAL
jgi:hypothetical protein